MMYTEHMCTKCTHALHIYPNTLKHTMLKWELCYFLTSIDGPDFQGSMQSLTFGPSISRICRSITLVDNNISEDLEEFQVAFMTPTAPRVFVGSPAQILIMDDDSEE